MNSGALRLATVVVPLVMTVSPELWCQERLGGAWALLARGRYEEALEVFRRDLERGLPEAARGVVMVLRELGRYPEAAEAARRGGTWLLLGEVLRDRGESEAADSAFRRALTAGRSDSIRAVFYLARSRYERGDREGAAREFGNLVAFYNRGLARSSEEIATVAAAARFLGRWDPQFFPDALRLYDEAIELDSANTAARVELGEMFLEKFNGTDARSTFEAILRRNPRHPEALYGLARVARFELSPEAMALVGRSLETNPNSPRSRALLAEFLLDGGVVSQARAEVERALAVNPRQLHALSVLGAVLLLSGSEGELAALQRRVEEMYPNGAEFYVQLADIATRNRWYPRAATLAARAVELDPQAWRGFALLGINQLRLGQMGEGRANLERAFRGDPYDPWTKNTLDLLDVMDSYAVRREGNFRFVVDSSQAELLYLYLGDLARAAYDSLRARYGADLPFPLRVELFSRHADFSVRIVGLVGLGALGASFGPVIAMDGPSARPAGEFHWGSTLWHELAHSFHLYLTEYRVPRWFTEGLAVYEERRARPGWGGSVSADFLLAFKEGRLRALRELDRGFSEPEYPEQVLHSYYQASLVCEFLAARYGLGVFRRLLEAFEAGRSAEVAFQEILGMDFSELESAFEEYVRARFASALSALARRSREGSPAREAGDPIAQAALHPGDFSLQLAAGKALWERRDRAAAAIYFRRARSLFPEYTAKDSPYRYLARIHRERGELVEAASELERLTHLDASHFDAWLELAEIKESLGDLKGAISALEQALYVYPLEVQLHARLAGLAERAEDWQRAVRERRAVLALKPTDLAEAEYLLARAYFGSGDMEAARKAVLRALERAPGFRAAQELLLAIRAQKQED